MSSSSSMDLKRYIHGYSTESLNLKDTTTYDLERTNKVPRWRQILAQMLAASAINLILFDIGLALSYPTLVLPSLQLKTNTSLNHSNEEPHYSLPRGFSYNASDVGDNLTVIHVNQNEATVPPLKSYKDPFLHLSFFHHFVLTEYEISWYVSIVYICQPIGSILGGSIVGYLGRKRLMQVVNLFMFSGWLLPFFSTTPVYMYASNILFGIGIGCSEAPIATYLSEITQVSVRGVILTLAQVYLSVSFLVPYLISLVISSWRWQALVLSSVPVLTLLICTVVPETPVWLISKQHHKEAEGSLKWLRGWTSSEQIKEELEEIAAHHLDACNSTKDPSTVANAQKSTEELFDDGRGVKETVLYFVSPRMRRPFFIVCVLFALLYVSGMGTIRPYLVQLFKDMGITMNPDKCALWVTLAGVVGNIGSLCLVKYTGKRFIVLTALGGSATCTLVIALIKTGTLPTDWGFVMFLAMSFFSGYGIVPLPWILQSELYPFRGRGFAGGLGAAFSYFIGFISTKTFLDLSVLISLEGIFIMFTCFSILGLVYLWIRLPETEGKSFQQIDQYFNRLNDHTST